MMKLIELMIKTGRRVHRDARADQLLRGIVRLHHPVQGNGAADGHTAELADGDDLLGDAQRGNGTRSHRRRLPRGQVRQSGGRQSHLPRQRHIAQQLHADVEPAQGQDRRHHRSRRPRRSRLLRRHFGHRQGILQHAGRQ